MLPKKPTEEILNYMYFEMGIDEEDWFLEKLWEGFRKVVLEPPWIEWNGGECPVLAGRDIEVRLSDGGVSRNKFPEYWGWYHVYRSGDIIAYRDWTSWEEGK